jgi:hypothetical protein
MKPRIYLHRLAATRRVQHPVPGISWLSGEATARRFALNPATLQVTDNPSLAKF